MTEQKQIELAEGDLAIVLAILQDHIPDRPVFVFGSRVTGRARRRSDLDLAIGGEKPLTLREEADLCEAFDQSDLPISVDVVDLAHAKGVFRRRIENEWVPLVIFHKEQQPNASEAIAA